MPVFTPTIQLDAERLDYDHVQHQIQEHHGNQAEYFYCVLPVDNLGAKNANSKLPPGRSRSTSIRSSISCHLVDEDSAGSVFGPTSSSGSESRGSFQRCFSQFDHEQVN